MVRFQRGWTVGNSSLATDKQHAQLWVPKAKLIAAHVREIHVEAPAGWHLVMSSTKLGNRPFGGQTKPDGISLDGNYLASQAELWDERRSDVPAGMLGSFSGDEDLIYELGALVVKGNDNDPTEIGAGLTIRSETNNGLRVTFVWEEVPLE